MGSGRGRLPKAQFRLHEVEGVDMDNECGGFKERCLMISNGFRWVKRYAGLW